MKRFLTLALAVCMVLSMSAVAFADGGEKVLNVGWPYDASTLDPARASVDSEYRVLIATNEPLLRDVEGEAQPGSAESYEVNDDQTEYVFHLREDNVYSDGTPITAADFQYALERLLNPDEGYEEASTAFIIKNAEAYYMGEADVADLGIEAVDDYTLKLTMEYSTYPINFCRWEFSPINQATAEEYGLEYGAAAEKVLTNGPFTVTSWVRDSEMVLEKNANYWNADAINLDKVVLKIGASGDVAVDMLLTDELDLAEMGSQVRADTMTDNGFESMIHASGVQCLHINHAGMTEESGLFLSNVNFRKALSYAIDRNAMVATAYTTDMPATRMTLPTEMGVEGLFHEEYPYEAWPAAADPDKAKECLDLALSELGKTVEDIPTFSLLCSDSNNNMVALNAIMDMWNKTLGINCEIDAQPAQNMIQKMYNGEFDFWKGGLDTGIVDSFEMFEYFYSPDSLFGVQDEKFDELYNAVRNTTTWQDRKDAMFEMEKEYCESMLDLTITWMSTYYSYNPRVTGLTLDSNAINFVYADITE